MARIIKSGLIKVPTQPKDFDLKATELVFRSYDNQPALEFNIEKQDGTPADLLGATLRLLMYVYDEVDGTVTKEPIPFITKNLITESFLNGHVKYILPEALKAYNGVVETYVYIEYPDGSTSDNLGFTFRMKRSAIDGLAQDKADYFIEDFKQLLAAASLEANKTIEGLDTEIKNLQQAAKDANKAVDGAMGRIDGLEAEIGQLERLREMYIDTLGFEGYDYSGRPNLMPNLDFSKLSRTNANIQAPPPYIKDGGTFFILDATDTSATGVTRNVFIPMLGRLEKGAHYAVTIPMMVSEDFGTNYSGSPVYPYNITDGTTTTRPLAMTPNADCRGKWQLIKKAFTVPSSMMDGNFAPFLQVYQNADQTGKLYIGYDIKIEKIASLSDQATPFQPNLLAEPYNMCREYPNENIADPTKTFPIKTREYLVYSGANTEPYIAGQQYILTMKATKPGTQTFNVFINEGTIGFGSMTPVEGLTDVWQKKITVGQNHIDAGVKDRLTIYQVPNSSVGNVQIDWLKIEKGDTRTPIKVPTYKGLGILDTDDPTKYVWNYTELVDVDGIQDALEHVEQRTLVLEDEQEKIDGRLTNVNTKLNTVQSTADQILAEVTAADVMKETDLPGYLANKPIAAGGMADFAGKATAKKHPCPHNLAVAALELEHADMAPNGLFKYEPSQTHYDKIGKLDDAVQLITTKTSNKVAVLGMKFDLISQISKDYPTFFDDCATTAEKVKKIQSYIEGATLTIYGQGISTNIEVSAATGNNWTGNMTFQQGTQQYEIVYNDLETKTHSHAHTSKMMDQ